MADAPDASTGSGLEEKRRFTWLLLFLVPLVLVGPTLLRGDLFLPQLPSAHAPFREEAPTRAEAALEEQNFPTADRLYPVLTDQVAMRAALERGELPLWEPLLGLGLPLFAQSLAGAAYPPNWLGFLIAPERAAGPLAMLTLLLAGLGAWLFLGRIGLHPIARLFGALAYQVGGWGVANLFLYMKVDAGLWLPWALWAVEGIARQRRGSSLWLTVSLGCSVLAGMPTIGVFVCCAAGLYAIARLTPLARHLPVGEDQELDAHTHLRWPPLAVALAFAVLGLGSAAVLLAPTIEASRESVRQAASLEVLEGQSLPPTTLFGTVVHDLVGAPTEATPPGRLPVAGWITPASRGTSAENANQLEWNTYAGLVVVLLACVATISAPRRAALPALLLLAVLGFAQGWPLVKWFYRVPGLDGGNPTRVLALAWFLWPWLAAVGLDRVLAGVQRSRAALHLGALLASGLSLWLWLDLEPEAWARALDALLIERYGAFSTPADVRALFSFEEAVQAAGRLRASYALLAGASAATLVVALVAMLTGRRTLGLGLLAVMLAEGVVASDGHLVGRPALDGVFPASDGIQAIQDAAGDGRVVRLDRSANGTTDVLELARPNVLEAYGVADLAPWIVFPPRTFLELFGAIDPGARVAQGVSRISTTDVLDHPVLDLARVSCVLSREPLVHERLEPVLERDGFCVYRRLGALRPARIVERAVVASGEEAGLLALAQRQVEFSTTTMLAPGASITNAVPEEAAGAESSAPRIVRLERPRNGRIEVDVADARGGWLVVHEQSYPGWRATRNGQPVELLRADHVYQAVELAPGRNEVVLEYAPASFQLGSTLSLLSLLLAVLGTLWLRS